MPSASRRRFARVRRPACAAPSAARRAISVVAWSEALYPDQLRDLADPPLCLFVRGGADAASARGSPLRPRRHAARRGRRHALAVSLRRGHGPAGGRRSLPRRRRGRQRTRARDRRHRAEGRRRCSRCLAGGGPGCRRRPASLHRRRARLRRRRRLSAPVTPASTRASPAVVCPQRVRLGRAGARLALPGAQPGHGRARACGGPGGGREAERRADHRGARLRSRARRALRPRRGRTQAQRGAQPAAGRGRACLRERRRRPARHRRGRSGAWSESGRRGRRAAGCSCSTTAAARCATSCARSQVASFTIDELSVRLGLPASKVAAAVSDLEVEGLARRVDGGRYRRLRS